MLLISRLINRSGLRISHSKVFSSVSTISNQKFFRLVDYNLVENEKEKKISILHESYFFLTTIREKSASFIYSFLFCSGKHQALDVWMAEFLDAMISKSLTEDILDNVENVNINPK